MPYRIQPIEVPDQNPFENDVLERKPTVEFLCALIGRLDGPFVLALDSRWGTGKTTLIRMIEAVLKNQNYCCIYFNAWKVDYVTDPLVALVSSIEDLNIGSLDTQNAFKTHLGSVKKVTSLIAKRTAVAAAKVITAGALNLDEEIESAVTELAGESVNDIVGAFKKEGRLLEKFRSDLESAVAELSRLGKKTHLILFVDEIDRCRPTFSIELLERIKHLFDVPNIIFVLSLDKKQLQSSIATVYGQDIDAADYLRRFIDLEYSIPSPNLHRFTKSLMTKYAMVDYFSERSKYSELQNDYSDFVSLFTELSELTSLSLRTQERCFTRLKVILDQTPSDHYLLPFLTTLLIILRVTTPELYIKFVSGEAGSQDVMDYIRSMSKSQKFLQSRSSLILEAYLIQFDENQTRKAQVKDSLKEHAENMVKGTHSGKRSAELYEMLGYLSQRDYRFPRLSYLANKVDLASNIQS